MSAPIDLGDGLTCFKAGTSTFHIDLVEWLSWYSRWQAPPDAPAWQLVDDVVAKLEKETGVRLNRSQAEALLHGIGQEYTDVKKKRLAQQS